MATKERRREKGSQRDRGGTCCQRARSLRTQGKQLLSTPVSLPVSRQEPVGCASSYVVRVPFHQRLLERRRIRGALVVSVNNFNSSQIFDYPEPPYSCHSYVASAVTPESILVDVNLLNPHLHSS